MRKFIGFAATCALLCGDISIATAADAGGWVTCKDGMQMHGGGACANHGGVLIEENKSTPVDTTKGLEPKTATKAKNTNTQKTKTQKTAATSETKNKTVSKRSNSPTAKCKDGAMYFSTERHGACASHGGVRQWY
jgi:alpha-acetolactate decarboxylase